MLQKTSIQDKINLLPEHLTHEVEDFLDFLIQKYQIDKNNNDLKTTTSLQGSVINYVEPFSPVLDSNDWEK